jgi:ferredoxin-NADP reductase
VEPVTHDVKRFTIQKPEGFKFIPGQATEVSINTPALKMKKATFTFTSLNDNKQLNLH